MSAVNIFPWDDNFNTGLELIDHQHRKLVDLLNVLADHIVRNSAPVVLGSVLNELSDYARYHFEAEEAIWGEYFAGDALEIGHKSNHDSFISSVLDLKEMDNRRSPDLLERVLAFLTRWLASHILERDRHAAMVVKGLQLGMPLEEAKLYAEREMSGSTRVLIDIILSVYSTLSTNAIELMHEVAARKKAHQELLEFTEILSHHLQEPVRQQLLYSGALDKAVQGLPDNDEMLFAARQVQSGAKRLRHLLHDMEIYLSTASTHVALTLCNSENAARRAMKNLHHKISERQAEIELNHMPPVLCMERFLSDLFMVLLDNSLTYVHANQTPRIRLGGDRNENLGTATLWVEDNGIGIGDDFRERVFRVFEQLDRHRFHDGTGIGLSVAKKVVDLCSGRIWIEPAEGGGTRVSFTLKTA